MKVFETDRLIIRRLNKNDIDAFHDMQSNPRVMRYIKPFMNRDESELELARFMSYYEDGDIRFDIWAIDQKSSNTFVGICGMYENDQSETEIAYRLREVFWGKGIASEVTRGLIKYCFSHTNIDRLCAYVRSGNTGSIHILEREMKFIHQFYSAKGKCEERYYNLTKTEWAASLKNVMEKVQITDALALTELTIRSKDYWNYGTDQIDKWIADLTITEEYITENILYKLINNNRILGYYSLIRESDLIIKMDNLFIEPEYIGKGFGSVLLNHACERSLSLGYKIMNLDADPHAEQFYIRHGFKVIGQLPTSIKGRFLPIMKKELTQ